MDLNKVMLIGRLAQDPELRSLPSGGTVASFSVATSRQWKNSEGERQKQTEFHRVVVWGKLAEIAGEYLHKGRQIYIEGRLHTRDWTGEDKVKHYRTEVVTENFIMLDGAKRAPMAAESEKGEAPQEVIEEEVRVEAIPF